MYFLLKMADLSSFMLVNSGVQESHVFCLLLKKNHLGKNDKNGTVKKNGTVHCTKISAETGQDLRFFFATIFMNHPSGTEIWEDLWTFPMILGRKFQLADQSKFPRNLVGVGSLPKKWWLGGGLVS